MGTVFQQPMREYAPVTKNTLLDLKDQLSEFAKEGNMSFKDAVSLYHAAELARANDLFVANGDIFDEQMAGMAKILDNMEESILSLNGSLSELVKK